MRDKLVQVTALDALIYTHVQGNRTSRVSTNIESTWPVKIIDDHSQRALAIVNSELPEQGSRLFHLEGLTVGMLANMFQRCAQRALLEYDTLATDAVGFTAQSVAVYWKYPILVEGDRHAPYFGVWESTPEGRVYLRNLIVTTPNTLRIDKNMPVVAVAPDTMSMEMLKEALIVLLQTPTDPL